MNQQLQVNEEEVQRTDNVYAKGNIRCELDTDTTKAVRLIIKALCSHRSQLNKTEKTELHRELAQFLLQNVRCLQCNGKIDGEVKVVQITNSTSLFQKISQAFREPWAKVPFHCNNELDINEDVKIRFLQLLQQIVIFVDNRHPQVNTVIVNCLKQVLNEVSNQLEPVPPPDITRITNVVNKTFAPTSTGMNNEQIAAPDNDYEPLPYNTQSSEAEIQEAISHVYDVLFDDDI
ncbi:predicted protein [Chaetoceros tenuissimus]|uniref:Uncharacterized protein n=1 Tax=Chaetoceros tenuissimus TaxID=426638 RepID=A0AAD3CEL3_9STRA|nr:predicted protein [Chaetoceros tenuissimus]